MPVIVLDSSTAEQLRAASTRTELHDQNGHLLGLYSPAEKPIPWEPKFTREELDATAAETGRPLANILADLRSRS